MKRITLILFLAMTLASCQNPTKWYPHADVTVAETNEYPGVSGGDNLQVTLVIHNTGDTSIFASTVTVKATTNKHRYMQSVTSTVRIIPGGKIALSVIFPYLESGEKLEQNGVSVYNTFFE